MREIDGISRERLEDLHVVLNARRGEHAIKRVTFHDIHNVSNDNINKKKISIQQRKKIFSAVKHGED